MGIIINNKRGNKIKALQAGSLITSLGVSGPYLKQSAIDIPYVPKAAPPQQQQQQSASSNHLSFYDYLKMANNGDATAQDELGNKYEYGLGVTRDYFKAFYWYKKAAQQDYPPAQFSLGYMYLLGKGIKVDTDKGNYWISKAKENGYPPK